MMKRVIGAIKCSACMIGALLGSFVLIFITQVPELIRYEYEAYFDTLTNVERALWTTTAWLGGGLLFMALFSVAVLIITYNPRQTDDDDGS